MCPSIRPPFAGRRALARRPAGGAGAEALTRTSFMNINVEHQPNCRAVLHVEVPADVVSQQRSEIVSHYASIAKVPGYRPGKAPASVIEKRYKDSVDSELQNQLINHGCREAIRKENMEVLQILSVRDVKLHKRQDLHLHC